MPNFALVSLWVFTVNPLSEAVLKFCTTNHFFSIIVSATDIKTYSNEMEKCDDTKCDDTIVFGELRRINTDMSISSVKTGGGDDIIMFTGLLAQPWDMALRRRGISPDLIADTGNAIHENNVVSFQSMSTGVKYEFEVMLHLALRIEIKFYITAM